MTNLDRVGCLMEHIRLTDELSDLGFSLDACHSIAVSSLDMADRHIETGWLVLAKQHLRRAHCHIDRLRDDRSR